GPFGGGEFGLHAEAHSVQEDRRAGETAPGKARTHTRPANGQERRSVVTAGASPNEWPVDIYTEPSAAKLSASSMRVKPAASRFATARPTFAPGSNANRRAGDARLPTSSSAGAARSCRGAVAWPWPPQAADRSLRLLQRTPGAQMATSLNVGSSIRRTNQEVQMAATTTCLDARLQERVAERTRVARELHDTLLQSFHGLVFRFQAAINMLPDRPVEAS